LVYFINYFSLRWTIEVFFKECKQYLKIENCKSSNFDAHITDITISMLQYIMLIYSKRINYMRSFGDLFKDVSKDLIELDIVTKMLIVLRKLIEVFSQITGIDLLILQKNMFENEDFLNILNTLIPKNKLEKVV